MVFTLVYRRLRKIFKATVITNTAVYWNSEDEVIEAFEHEMKCYCWYEFTGVRKVA